MRSGRAQHTSSAGSAVQLAYRPPQKSPGRWHSGINRMGSRESERVIMSDRPAAEDPERYHPESNIRQFLAAKSANAVTPELLPAAVHERWAVKTGSDADAQALTGQTPTPTTVAVLRALAVPALLPLDGRSECAEKTVWQLTAMLQTFRSESDGDYHLVIAGDQGNTMIAEIPNPGDITTPSFFAEQIATARTAFDSHFQITESISTPTAAAAPGPGVEPQSQQAAVPVTVTGLGYFDFNHGQLGVAPNATELHPVINIVFGG